MKDKLTKTEKPVMQLVAKGLTSKEIAHQTNRSVRTIETHRFNIYRKLQAKNASEAVSKAKDLHLI